MLFQEGGSEGEEGIPQTVSDNLYVVESAQLDLQEEDASIMLTRGPSLSLPPSFPPSFPPSLLPSLSFSLSEFIFKFVYSFSLYVSLSLHRSSPPLPLLYQPWRWSPHDHSAMAEPRGPVHHYQQYAVTCVNVGVWMYVCVTACVCECGCVDVCVCDRMRV